MRPSLPLAAASSAPPASPASPARTASFSALVGGAALALAALGAGCSEELDPSRGGDSQSSSGGSGGGTSDGGPGQQGSASSSSSGGSSGTLPDGGPAPDGGASKPTVLYAMTGSGDGKIRVFRVDQATAAWQPTGTFDAGSSPSFLAADTEKGRVYAVDESGGGSVLAFAFDRTAGTLSPLGSQPSGGSGPTHLSLDATRTHVLVAMYNAGRSAVFPLQPDGRLGAATDTKDAGEKAHLAITSPSGGYAFVPCLGVNRVVQYVFDAATGKLAPNPTAPFVNAPAGAGAPAPRLRAERALRLRPERARQLHVDVQLRQDEGHARARGDPLHAPCGLRRRKHGRRGVRAPFGQARVRFEPRPRLHRRLPRGRAYGPPHARVPREDERPDAAELRRRRRGQVALRREPAGRHRAAVLHRRGRGHAHPHRRAAGRAEPTFVGLFAFAAP